ncbi:hypothetical protein GZ78_27230 [Endozoicomonas numazuensis]|uniref:Uncharacterized protein n=2 Tax=Endozoicomonas numazuensis TaxID=1137799 RepID=A0A081N125_9GAMM|nr:hypothetical protein GZ78_27230 [Endozoicomonas numazuensis]
MDCGDMSSPLTPGSNNSHPSSRLPGDSSPPQSPATGQDHLGRQISETSTTAQLNHEAPQPLSSEPPHLNERKTEERPWFFQRWYRNYFAKEDTSTHSPSSDQELDAEDEQKGYWDLVKNLPGRAVGALANLPGTGYEKVASKLDGFVNSQAGIEMTNADEKSQWRSLLYDLLCSYTGVVVDGEQTAFRFNEILKKNGDQPPVKITALNFDSKRVVKQSESYLINGQATENHFEVGDLSCTVEIPVKNHPPLTIHLKLENTTVSVGTDIGITQLLKNQFISSAQDRTAAQLTAEKIEVRYENLDAYTELTSSAKPDIESDCMVGFESGKLTMENVRFCKPLNMLKTSSEQTSILTFDKLEYQNESTRPALVEVQNVKVHHLDDTHNGTFSSTLIIHPKMIRNIPYIGWLLAPIFSAPIHLDVFSFMKHGEVRMKDLKHGISVSGGGLAGWFVKKALTAHTTRLIPYRGGTGLQIGWPFEFVACKIDLPGLLPGKAASSIPIEDHDQMTFDRLNQRPSLESSIQRQHQQDEPTSEQSQPLHHQHFEALDKEEGVLIVPDTFSRVLSGIVSGNKALAHPLRMVPRLLEKRCIEAAKGDDRASQILLRFVQDQERFQHESDCMMALQAVPVEFYIKEASEADDQKWLWLEHVAHKLIAVDGQKAFELYKQLLKRRDIENASELASDVDWLIHLSKSLPKNTPEEKALAFRVAEFTYKSNPEKADEVIKLLIDWNKNKLYKTRQLSDLIRDLINNHPYFADPHHLVTLLNLLDRSHPEIVSNSLEQFPVYTLLYNLWAQDSIKAHQTLDFLKGLLVKHGRFKEAAELLIESGDHKQAERMLELAIGQGKPSALKVKMDLITRGIFSEEVTLEKEVRRLKQLTETPATSQTSKEEAFSVIAEVITQRPHPELAGIFLEDLLMTEDKKVSFVKAVNGLFDLQTDESSTPQDRLKTLNQIEEHLKSARTDESTYLNKPLMLKQIQEANHRVDQIMQILIKIRSPMESVLHALLKSPDAEAATSMAVTIATESSPETEDDGEFFDALEQPYHDTMDNDPLTDLPTHSLNPVTENSDVLAEALSLDQSVPTTISGSISAEIDEEEDDDEIELTSNNYVQNQYEESPLFTDSLSSYASLLSQPVFSRPSKEFLDPRLREEWASILQMRTH